MHAIKKIAKACKISDRIMQKIPNAVKNHQTEKELANFIRKQIIKTSSTSAFKIIVASANNSGTVHHYASNDEILEGFLMVDFGVKYKGYVSDCTRMFYLGKPSQREKKIYSLVLKAQKKAMSAVKPGMHARDIDAIARTEFGRYKKYFRHSLGHGLGRKVHQAPYLKPKSRQKLKTGNVITIEPGLYFKNKFGVRIEDVILVTSKGYKPLTLFPKKLYTIKA